MRLRIVPAVLALSVLALSGLGVLCVAVSCRRSETSGPPDAGERSDPKVACARLAHRVRDTYGTLRNHYDWERWEKLVGQFDGARADTLKRIGESLHFADQAGSDIIMGGAEPWNQAGRASDAERRARSKMVDEMVMEARRKAQEDQKQTDAKLAAFVTELERSSDPSCERALAR